jgi:hypothetical protein
MAAAIAAVRAIRGDILPYLVLWIAVPGFMSLVTAVAWLVPERRVSRLIAIGLAVLTIGLTMTVPVPRAPVFRDRDVVTEQLAADIDRALLTARVTSPVVRIASSDVWPLAAGVVLHLYKQGMSLSAEPLWASVFGTSVAVESGEHAGIVIGDRAFAETATARPDLTRIAQSGDVSAYLEEPGFLARHRLPSAPALLSSTGIDRDPHLAADGVMPPNGTPWDSPASAIFHSPASSLAVRVPPGDVIGVVVSVDGNDLYTIRCGAHPELSWSIGAKEPQEGLGGMQTRFVFSDRIESCEGLELRPVSGDGLFSVGEIAFLHK